MTSCPPIASQTDENIELSTYDVTAGTYVVLACKGFGRHIADPTNVICLSTGVWSAEPNLTCSGKLDERESIMLAVGLVCAVLVIVAVSWICCYFCCCHRDPKRKYFRYGYGNTWRERFFRFGRDSRNYDDDFNYGPKYSYRESRHYGGYSPRESRKEVNIYNVHNKSMRHDFDDVGSGLRKAHRDSVSDQSYNFRKTRRNSFTYGSADYQRPDIRSTRHYSFAGERHQESPVDYRRTRRHSDSYMYRPEYRSTRRYETYEPEVRRVYRTPPYDLQPGYTIYNVKSVPRQLPVANDIIRYVDMVPEYKPRETKVIEYIEPPPVVKVVDSGVDNYGFVQSETKSRLNPVMLNPNTVYVKYETRGSRNIVSSVPVPKARITELPDDEVTEIVPYSSLGASRFLGNTEVDQTAHYFQGRQDFPYERSRRTQSSGKELDHVLYHGKGKMTEIYEENDGNERKSRILRSSQVY